jgi:hypothetical protein
MFHRHDIDDRNLLQEAAQTDCPRLVAELTPAVLAALSRERGIDFTTALFYDRLTRRPDVAALLSNYRAHLAGESTRPVPPGRLAIVPGAFYREYPDTGADGRVIRDEAVRLGWETARVPLRSIGHSLDNARLLCDWLRQQTHSSLVLVSLSKGGADLKAALARPEASEAFARVSAWINLGGIVDGSPMVDWVCARPIARLWYRTVCLLARYDFDAFTALRRGSGGWIDTPLSVPPHIDVVNVVGVPLRRHLSSPRSRRWHRRLAVWGPNDSVTLLSDVCRWPGRVLPIWGTDHYLQDGWNPRRLIPYLLSLVSPRHSPPGQSALLQPQPLAAR